MGKRQRVNANDKGWQRGNVATVLVAGELCK